MTQAQVREYGRKKNQNSGITVSSVGRRRQPPDLRHLKLPTAFAVMALLDLDVDAAGDLADFLFGKSEGEKAASVVEAGFATLARMRTLPRERRHDLYEELSRSAPEHADLDPERVHAVLETLRPEALAERLEAGLISAAQWTGRTSSLTSRAHFNIHFGGVPIEQRPFAHVVRARARLYYDALMSMQSKAGASMSDLFPIDAETHSGRSLTGEQLKKSKARRREKERVRQRALRARLKNEQLAPS